VRDLPLDVVSLESDAFFVAWGEIDTVSPVGSVDDVVVDEPVGGEAEGVKRGEGERATEDTVAIEESAVGCKALGDGLEAVGEGRHGDSVGQRSTV
jgi:hypothetical protein